MFKSRDIQILELERKIDELKKEIRDITNEKHQLFKENVNLKNKFSAVKDVLCHQCENSLIYKYDVFGNICLSESTDVLCALKAENVCKDFKKKQD